jgi:FkbM family methyltransferase
MPIFDVGANVGWLTKTFLDFSENVVAVEPDTFNQNVLRKRFGKNYRFNLVSKAVSSSEGLRELLILEEGSALNTFSSKWKKELESGYFSKRWLFSSRKQIVPTTTLDGLIAEFGLPYLAKIDVEGHELEVFKGLSQPIPLIVFEANLPVFLEETKQILEILTRLDANVLFNYSLKFEPELPNYVPSMELPKAFESMGKCTVEIIGRMSNYFEYYQPINEKN